MSMTKNNAQWVVKKTADDVALFARDAICQAAQQAIRDSGSFKIVLAGGTTPRQVYSLLEKEDCDWQNWHLYLGDERCLPPNDAERNSYMVQHSLLDGANIPEENIHFIPAELGARQAATTYGKVIDAAIPFDMVLLGMGEDGHTASLFPGQSHDTSESVHAVFDAPKLPLERVSLSSSSLSENKHLLIIVTGSTKHHSVLKWQKGKMGEGAEDGENLPVAQIGSRGNAVILLDNPAWSRKG